jgi:succinyl-CoA synthetase beta subunit
MRLYEYQAKEVFRSYDIPVPKGCLVKEKNQIEDAFTLLKTKDGVVIKAQVLAGGRGKAGGVKFAHTPDEVSASLEHMKSLEIGGYKVSEILLEEKLPVRQELYLGFVIDPVFGTPTLLASSRGGMDVEEIARTFPQLLGKINIDSAYGILDYKVRELLTRIGLPKNLFGQFITLCKRLYEIFLDYEVILLEINPLIVDEEQNLIAADARMSIDDAAVFRRLKLKELRDSREKSLEENLRDDFQLEFVNLEGNIGLVSGGAGMTMTAMDLITLEGGKPACFMDCSANVSPEGYEMALRTVSSKEGVSSILVNIFGGLTRMDHVGEYLVEAIRKIGTIQQPITIRLEGTNAEKGRKAVKEAGFQCYETFEEAVKRAVELGRSS